MKLLPVLLLVVCGALAKPGDLSKMPPRLAEFFKKNFGTPGGAKPPAREEVSYTLVEKNDKFEERIYPAWNWVCIEVKSEGDHMMDFLELAMYMQGENAAGELMQLTIPVMMQRRAGGGAAMCAPLPASHQASLPAPLTDNIRLVAVPQTAVYVRRFGGVAQRKDWAEQAGTLQRHLTEAERAFQSTVISAMFSDPAQREGRRNEIWLIKA
ncbi:Heme-binding protein 1 [Amphibalanus amphitrite]|uniref:Heme-binding protein 1 n=1 Tax=Amphibalanus amphitrite TaxID=1232801 RepID=A0A6A4WF72_AMPAM|nr:heme-binding protein 1-like [Amphibalanus amphitrite]XP_043214455.1 heme-binding protein 1-like [Amphibalanus amphitrite]KAF0302280.1 Heme-binding protein 1 [Amphibalanus amphitrite]